MVGPRQSRPTQSLDGPTTLTNSAIPIRPWACNCDIWSEVTDRFTAFELIVPRNSSCSGNGLLAKLPRGRMGITFAGRLRCAVGGCVEPSRVRQPHQLHQTRDRHQVRQLQFSTQARAPSSMPRTYTTGHDHVQLCTSLSPEATIEAGNGWFISRLPPTCQPGLAWLRQATMPRRDPLTVPPTHLCPRRPSIRRDRVMRSV